MNKEKRKEYAKKYYLAHREELIERNRQWRLNHKERFYELVYKSRKKKAEELRQDGFDYVWHSAKKRSELYDKRYKRTHRSIKNEEI